MYWSTGNGVCICMWFERIRHHICVSATPLSFNAKYTRWLKLRVCAIKDESPVEHALWLTSRMRFTSLSAICEKTKPKFNLGCLPWKARVITK